MAQAQEQQAQSALEKKELKPVITRVFRREETHKNGDKRIVTVVYKYDRTTKELTYGASIFHQKPGDKDYFVKSNLRKTAKARLIRRYNVRNKNRTKSTNRQKKKAQATAYTKSPSPSSTLTE